MSRDPRSKSAVIASFLPGAPGTRGLARALQADPEYSSLA